MTLHSKMYLFTITPMSNSFHNIISCEKCFCDLHDYTPTQIVTYMRYGAQRWHHCASLHCSLSRYGVRIQQSESMLQRCFSCCSLLILLCNRQNIAVYEVYWLMDFSIINQWFLCFEMVCATRLTNYHYVFKNKYKEKFCNFTGNRDHINKK